ncbi:MAG: hypothetical protein Tsb0014_40630 [Pleurocapsa sp.]
MKDRVDLDIGTKEQQLDWAVIDWESVKKKVRNLRQRIYQETGSRPKSISRVVLTQAKKTPERAWLSEVSSVVLQQSLRDLEVAWTNYFSSLKGERKGKSVGKPKFKKKSSRQAIRFTTNAFSVHSNSVKLAKIGHIRVVFSRPLPSPPSSVTIIKDTTGKYFASFVVETPQPTLPQTEASCGIDLGLIDFAVLIPLLSLSEY